MCNACLSARKGSLAGVGVRAYECERARGCAHVYSIGVCVCVHAFVHARLSVCAYVCVQHAYQTYECLCVYA